VKSVYTSVVVSRTHKAELLDLLGEESQRNSWEIPKHCSARFLLVLSGARRPLAAAGEREKGGDRR